MCETGRLLFPTPERLELFSTSRLKLIEPDFHEPQSFGSRPRGASTFLSTFDGGEGGGE